MGGVGFRVFFPAIIENGGEGDFLLSSLVDGGMNPFLKIGVSNVRKPRSYDKKSVLVNSTLEHQESFDRVIHEHSNDLVGGKAI